MGKGDGKSRRGGGRAVSVFGVSGRDIYFTFVAEERCPRRVPRGYRTTSGRRVRRCRACAGFSAPISCSASCPSAAWVVLGARRDLRRPRVCPPAVVPRKTRAPRSDAETVRGRTFHPSVSRAPGARLAPSTNIRVKRRSVYATCPRARVPIARSHLGIGLHTSANVGRLAAAAAGDPGDRRSDPDSSPTPPIIPPFSTPPSPTGVRPSTVSLRPTSLMRSLIVALTLRSRFPLTIARSRGHLNGRVFAPEPRIPRTHSRQNE